MVVLLDENDRSRSQVKLLIILKSESDNGKYVMAL